MVEKIAVILIIAAAAAGLLLYWRKERREDPCSNCKDCALKKECNKPQKQ